VVLDVLYLVTFEGYKPTDDAALDEDDAPCRSARPSFD